MPRLSVRVRATDRGGGLSEIRLFLNGKRIDQTGEPPSHDRDAGRLELSRSFDLVPGDNVIVAEGFSVLGRVRGPRLRAKVVRK